MRELKFRAWDTAKKKMVYRGLHDHNWYYTYKNDDEGCHWAYPINQRDAKWLKPVMQFVGFLDKNGKEIYEGDIIADEYGDDEMQGFITYDAKSAKYIRKSLNTIPEQEDFMDDLHEPRIIGNIYENPELLK
jgi:uncharacterized phage protein (TIGR01671 family)